MVVVMKTTAFWDIILGGMEVQRSLQYITEDSTVFTVVTGSQITRFV
jgi:hypothetical protein